MRALIYTLSAWIAFQSLLHARDASSDEMSQFAQELSQFVTARDLDGVMSLYFFEGTPSNLQEAAYSRWKIYLHQTHFEEKFKGVEGIPIDQYKSSGNMENFDKYIGSTQIDGVTYVHTAPVVGVVLVHFGKLCALYPVGFSPNGNLCLLGKKKNG